MVRSDRLRFHSLSSEVAAVVSAGESSEAIWRRRSTARVSPASAAMQTYAPKISVIEMPFQNAPPAVLTNVLGVPGTVVILAWCFSKDYIPAAAAAASSAVAAAAGPSAASSPAAAAAASSSSSK